MWPGGGEALYRNGEYVGAVSNSAYGFTLEKMVCLGFIQHPDSFRGTPKILEVSITNSIKIYVLKITIFLCFEKRGGF